MIAFSASDVKCRCSLVERYRVVFLHAGISVKNSYFKNCDLVALGSAALISVADSVSVSDGGGSSVQIESSKGYVQLSNVSVCTVNIKSLEGSMNLDNIKGIQLQVRARLPLFDRRQCE